MLLRYFRIIVVIGIIEILIGGITLAVTYRSLVLDENTKSFSVLLFVITAAILSTILGVGILKLNSPAYKWLIYFSSVVLLSKLLIFLDVIQLNGSLETSIPSPIKNGISIIYHGYLIYFLRKEAVKQIFHI